MFLLRLSDTADTNGDDSSSSSSEEEKEAACAPPVNGLKPGWSPAPHSDPPLPNRKAEDDEQEEEGSCLPTIFFSHTVEPKKVRLQMGGGGSLLRGVRVEQLYLCFR